MDEDSTEWTATVDYGDGTGLQSVTLQPDRTFSLTHSYSNVASSPFTVVVRVVDNGGRVGSASTTVVVQSSGPVVAFNQFSITSVVREGEQVRLAGNFSDPASSSIHSVLIDWADGTSSTIALPTGEREFVATHVYNGDGPSNSPRDSYRVSVTVIDGSGRSDTTPIGLYVVEVDNVKPTNLTLTGLPATVSEGQPFVLNGSFVDPGVRDSHLVTVDWGDGTAPETRSMLTQSGQLPLRSFSFPHVYRNNPVAPNTAYTITVSVADEDDSATPTTLTRSINVVNIVPTIVSSILSSTILAEGGQTTLNIAFGDPGQLDTHEVVVDWGDGSRPDTYALAAGVFSLTGLTHRYLNNMPGNTPFVVTVRVRDNDMPLGVYATSSQSILVLNSEPVITTYQLYLRDVSGEWVASAFGANIAEGSEVRVTGSYADVGTQDSASVRIEWYSGKSVIASVDSDAKTFKADFIVTDDYPLGTSSDSLTLLATITDSDGGSATTSRELVVYNVAPIATVIPDRVTDPRFIPLRSDVRDPSLDDLATMSYQWTAVGSSGTQTASTRDLLLDRNSVGDGLIRLTLIVSDDDGASFTFSSAMLFGTSGDDTLSIRDSDFATAGVNTLIVVSLSGSDVIDGSLVTNPNLQLILDGGDGPDQLYGGAGNDIFVLRGGNDTANVPSNTITPNESGNDRYLLSPNSVLTVIDRTGNNTLDFSLANFGLVSQPSLGVTFDLSQVSQLGLVQQDVAPGTGTAGLHYVAAQGSFLGLIGSGFNDTLTTRSGAFVDAGAGSDKIIVGNGVVGGRLSGGADADVFSINGQGISTINFEGDAGADIFDIGVNATLSGVNFGGGADNDIFNIMGGTLTGISFEGDSGADVFTVSAGGSLSSIDFSGGADNDVFNFSGGNLTSVNFEGDVGADIFNISGNGTLSGVIFGGGADNDIFNISTVGSLSGINFEGDAGADIFVISPNSVLSGVNFGGGADNDIFSIGANVTLTSVNFEGDAGADILSTFGVVLGTIRFDGGADSDLLTVPVGSSVSAINFEGDVGADELRIIGGVGGTIIFSGGADADVLTVTGLALGGIIFSGGADKDIFNAGGTISTINFEGDVGADELRVTGIVTGIVFSGGADADVLTISGTVLGGIIFNGGADRDVFTAGGTISSINFEGDVGADELRVTGTVTGSINFGGGADVDVLTVTGLALGGIVFSGGADKDVFLAGGTIGTINFEGDAGADELTVTGNVTSIIFSGGADADVLTISGGVTGSIIFSGGADNDVFIAGGTITSINFEARLTN